jgi:hypothetical protein
MLSDFSFGDFDPSTLRDSIFLNSIPLLPIVGAPDASTEGFKFGLNTKTNGALPLDPACPECSNVQSLAGLPYLT